jgi:hypothetical protein
MGLALEVGIGGLVSESVVLGSDVFFGGRFAIHSIGN